MALDPRWKRTRRELQPGLDDTHEPTPVQFAFGVLGLIGILGLVYYLAVSTVAVNFFAQSPP